MGEKTDFLLPCLCGADDMSFGADGAGGYIVYCKSCLTRAPCGAETKREREWFWNQHIYSATIGQLSAKDREIAELLARVTDAARELEILRSRQENHAHTVAELERKFCEACGERDQWKHDASALVAINKTLLGAQDKLEAAEARIAEQQETVDQAVAMAEYLEGHSKGAMAERVKTALSAGFAQERAKYIVSLRNEHYDLQGEHTETLALLGAWQQRAQRAESERDEARECVGRLHATGALLLEQGTTTYARGPVWDGLRQAINETPEHLR